MNMMPVVKFFSSDTGNSCATAVPYFQKPAGNCVRFTDGKVGTADATLGTNNSGGRTGYVLVWEKDGISHTIIGKIPREEILKIAESIS